MKGRVTAEGARAHWRFLNIIMTEEQNRMKERMSVVRARSQPRLQTRLNCAGFPHFVLDEVLDIAKAERQARTDASVKNLLREKDIDDDEAELEENVLLSNLCLVHRSRSLPAQKALGQVVWIYTRMKDLRCCRRAVEGPWTYVVAITLRDRFDVIRILARIANPASITYPYYHYDLHYDLNDS